MERLTASQDTYTAEGCTVHERMRPQIPVFEAQYLSLSHVPYTVEQIISQVANKPLFLEDIPTPTVVFDDSSRGGHCLVFVTLFWNIFQICLCFLVL